LAAEMLVGRERPHSQSGFLPVLTSSTSPYASPLPQRPMSTQPWNTTSRSWGPSPPPSPGAASKVAFQQMDPLVGLAAVHQAREETTEAENALRTLQEEKDALRLESTMWAPVEGDDAFSGKLRKGHLRMNQLEFETVTAEKVYNSTSLQILCPTDRVPSARREDPREEWSSRRARMLPRACSTRARAGLLTQVVAHKRKLAQRVEEAHAAEQEALERARAFEQRRRETREAAQREQDALAALAKVSSPTHPPSYARASGLEASLPESYPVGSLDCSPTPRGRCHSTQAKVEEGKAKKRLMQVGQIM
jgi:hypothetical protein